MLETSNSYDSVESSTFMSKSATVQTTTCSDSSTAASSIFSVEDMTIFSHGIHDGARTLLPSWPPISDSNPASSSTSKKLSFMLDKVRVLTRLGRNATLRFKCKLPAAIRKSDIHVQVDIDQRAPGSSTPQKRLEKHIQHIMQRDLQAIYTATADSARLVLCVVVVVVADGSFYRSLLDVDGVMGLAEIGLVWRLFEADDLTVYDGGVVAQSQEGGVTDFIFGGKGRQCLLEKLVPSVTNEIKSRIGELSEHLSVKF